MPRKQKAGRRKNPGQEQLAIRKALGYGHALADDGQSRITGTAESARTYERHYDAGAAKYRIGTDGALAEMVRKKSINRSQAEAAERYRIDLEATVSHGLQSKPLDLKVDGGRQGGEMPLRIMESSERVRAINARVGADGVLILEALCLHDKSINAMSSMFKADKRVIALLIKQCLDEAAIHYGIMSDGDRHRALSRS